MPISKQEAELALDRMFCLDTPMVACLASESGLSLFLFSNVSSKDNPSPEPVLSLMSVQSLRGRLLGDRHAGDIPRGLVRRGVPQDSPPFRSPGLCPIQHLLGKDLGFCSHSLIPREFPTTVLSNEFK